MHRLRTDFKAEEPPELAPSGVERPVVVRVEPPVELPTVVPGGAVASAEAARTLKRALDVLGASVLLVLAAPVMVVCAIAVRLGSRGPILFKQWRVGKGGRPFRIYKLRTMVVDAEDMHEELRAQSRDPDWLALDNDPRVTRIGRFLRRLSIDELPQLWNVLRGEMSLVGPRPLPLPEDERVPEWACSRRDVLPGITGLWQVRGRNALPFAEMVRLDHVYVSGWSLWLDLKLILGTVPVVLLRRGAL